MSSAAVLAVVEHRRGELRDISQELLTVGRELADAIEGDLHVAVISGDVETFAERLNRNGVDAIHAVESGEEFDHGIYTRAVEALHAELEPTALLMPNSVNGLDYAPAVAERLDLPLVTDATDLAYDEGITVTREMYGSKVETTVEVDDDRFAVTVRGGEWPAAEGSGDASIETIDLDVEEGDFGVRVQGYEEVAGGDVDITDADVLVSVGRGIGEEENLELIWELADALDATVSASRPIVDSGWLPKNRQVGQSGAVVTPDVYIAIGISGAVQHVAGMKGAETIVAVNVDPNAPIFDLADYGVVGDLFEVIPALIEEFK
ncbi:electron transfer flavoprotein subunit alpha/FixB family protein [Halopenitus sp. H-Gu1]|uniref:electron transfer flavoprotein subunit alpha/FixB family protein n=1 Tax=Halopenitus sp. H-Gu1 TaxID=3242697 RepID=UPI00359E9C46